MRGVCSVAHVRLFLSVPVRDRTIQASSTVTRLTDQENWLSIVCTNALDKRSLSWIIAYLLYDEGRWRMGKTTSGKTAMEANERRRRQAAMEYWTVRSERVKER